MVAQFLGPALWILSCMRCAPQMDASLNAQGAAVSIALLAAVLWPMLHRRSYLQHHALGLAALRCTIFAVPLTYSTVSTDAFAPRWE